MAHCPELIMALREKAAQAGAVVVEADSQREALAYAVDLTARQGGRTLAAPGLGASVRRRLEGLCRNAGVRVLHRDLRDHLEEMHTCLAKAELGIFQTGAVAVDTGSEDVRLALSLGRSLVVMLPRSRITLESVAMARVLEALGQDPPRTLALLLGARFTSGGAGMVSAGTDGPMESHLVVYKGR